MTAAARVDIVSNDAGELVRREHARELGSGVVVGIYRLAKLAQLHDLSNQAFLRQLEQSHQTIQEYCLKSGGNVNVMFAHRAIFVAGQLLKGSRGTYESAGELGEILEWCGGAELTITRDVTIEDLRAFAEGISLALRSERGSFKSSSQRIRLRPVAEAARLRGLDVERLAVEQRIVRSYANAVVILRRFYEDLAAGRMALPQRVKRVAQNLVDLSDGSTAAFLGVTQMRNANTDEAGRAVNSAIVAVLIARELTQDRATLSQIAMSAMMHDAGRPRALANAQKAGALGMVRAKLSEEDEDRLPAGTAAVMTALGRLNEASIRRTVITFEALWLRRSHSIGQPYGGARQATPHARILGIARRYNDLMTPDPGLPAPAPDHAIARLSAELVDPIDKTLLRGLVSALGLYPIGTVMQLTTGEVVEVVASKGGGAPLVRVVLDARGVAAAHVVDIDLATRPDLQIVRVLSTDNWRKGEGAIDAADVVAEPSHPNASQVRAVDVPQPAYAPPPPPDYTEPPSRPSQSFPSAPSHPSQQSFASQRSFSSVLTPGTSPSQVVEAVGKRATMAAVEAMHKARAPQASLPTIVETDDGRTVLARSPVADGEGDASVRSGATAVGNVQTTPVVHILVYVLEHGLTGSVEFHAPVGEPHYIHFSRGAPIKVKTGNRVAPLAKELVAAGVISEAAAAAAVTDAKIAGMLLGEYLIEKRKIRAPDLERALTDQMRKKLAAVVNLPPQTTYAFYQDMCLVEDEGELDIEPIGTILSVVRTWHDRVRIRATLQRIAGQLMQVHPDSTIAQVEMTEEEALVLRVMRENQVTLADLFRVEGLEEEAIATLAYTLAVTRHVILPGQRGGPMAIASLGGTGPQRSVHAGPPSRPSVRPSARHTSPPTQPVPPPSQPAPRSQRMPAHAPPPQMHAPTTPEAWSPTGIQALLASTVDPNAAPPPQSTQDIAPPPPSARQVPQHAQSTPYIPEPPPSVPASAAQPVAPSPPAPPVAPAPVPVASLSARTQDAIKELRGAEQALSRKDIGGAERVMKRAIQLDPDHPEIVAFNAWVQVMAGKKTPGEGIVALTQAIAKDPSCTRAYLFRAKLLKRDNKLREAATDFDAVLKREPDNKEAKSELNLLKLFVRR